ncbi:hypothetical protein BT69DRAFT_720437 [Atractiella rhizophila]|nr:hypothetical protein BT69DRAFT_720437 [Atractiella rhizophila]
MESRKAQNALSAALTTLNLLFHPLDDPTDPSTYLDPSSLPLPSGSLHPTRVLHPPSTEYESLELSAVALGRKRRDIAEAAQVFFAAEKQIKTALDGAEKEWREWIGARNEGWTIRRDDLGRKERGIGAGFGVNPAGGVRVVVDVGSSSSAGGGEGEEKKKLRIGLKGVEGKRGVWERPSSSQDEEGEAKWEQERWRACEKAMWEAVQKDARSMERVERRGEESFSLALPSGAVLDISYSSKPQEEEVELDPTLSAYATLIAAHLIHTFLSFAINSANSSSFQHQTTALLDHSTL